MSQVPRILNVKLKKTNFYTVQDPGPFTGVASPANLNDYEIIRGTYGLYYRGGKIGTVYELINIGNNVLVIKDIAGYLVAMLQEAKSSGINLRVTSGFRTMKHQLQLFQGNQDSSTVFVAKPGFNHHQIGIAVDFNVNDKRGQVYEWLVKNAYRFGFIRTVPNERWHWEYWGSWAEQQQPEWSKHKRLNHKQLSMFSKVPRIHSCGDGGPGGKFPVSESHWWTTLGASGEHTDTITEGMTNSWIGFSNEFLPIKFDRNDPHWGTKKF